ncbi:MAG: ABC transporter ATP-binding protein [Actinobacteria bacterium]|nr:ABC transporter ATP-binding protein [Actinomycetota bacterium]
MSAGDGRVSAEGAPRAIEARGISRRFGDALAVRDVSLRLARGETRALLGPNGAGKTTLLRILAGLIEPTAGSISLLGRPVGGAGGRASRRAIGYVPSGDRSFYLRLSGLENLVFFGRLHGLSRGEARRRASELLERVDLAGAAHRRVGLYSHGMQKRLAVARGLVNRPAILFVDEATHDLDPEGVRRVQGLVAEAAGGGTAVLWATQRLDEIRGHADSVTVLARGEVRFDGSVLELMDRSPARRYHLRLRDGNRTPRAVAKDLTALVAPAGSVEPSPTSAEHFVLSLSEEAVLGRALAAISAARVDVLACREERSEIEEAFLHLVGEERP